MLSAYEIRGNSCSGVGVHWNTYGTGGGLVNSTSFSLVRYACKSKCTTALV